MDGNAKLERFERIAAKRMNNAIRTIRLIGNLANRSNYSFQEEHIDQMLRALRREVKDLEGKFSNRSPNSTVPFRFKVRRLDRS